MPPSLIFLVHLFLTSGGEVSTFVRGGLDTPSSIVANHKDNTLFVTNEGSNTIAKITSSGINSSPFSSSSSFFS